MNLTLITATLGRPTLLNTAKYIMEQDYPVQWLVLFDGQAAFDRGKGFLPQADNIEVVVDKGTGEHFPLMFKHVDKIKTKYIGFIDDDNEMVPKHSRMIYEALIDNHSFVATQRVFSDQNMNIVSVEHPESSQVDTNNMGLTTELFKAAAEFYSMECKGNLFSDRHLTAYLLARNIKCHRIKNVYTINYKLNPVLDLKSRTNLKLLEDLNGTTIGSPLSSPASREYLLK